jgi:hypothetical protein
LEEGARHYQAVVRQRQSAVEEATERRKKAIRKHGRAILVKAQIYQTASPQGFWESLFSVLGKSPRFLVERRFARLCAVVAENPDLHLLFTAELSQPDASVWKAKADHLLDAALREIADAETSGREFIQEAKAREEEADRAVATLRTLLANEERKLHLKSGEKEERLRFLRDKVQHREQARQAVIEKFSMMVQASPLATVARPEIVDFNLLLDVTCRHESFQKAMRYWEGRWILAAKDVQDGRVNTKSGRPGTEARLRRWSMLTPCFIITLHSLPRLLTYAKALNEKDDAGKTKWVRPFLHEFVDLLIFDESGQVSPHIGMGAFSLARKAVVVGDVYQTEPVAKIVRGTDYANAKRVGLASLWGELEPLTPHFSCELRNGDPQGSIMRLAQQATSCTSPSMVTEPGIFLSEHRRCRDEIIAYCNELVYDGRLKPMSAKRKKEPPLLPLAWAHIRGQVQKRGGSSVNEIEAVALSVWLGTHAKAWRDHYGKPLEDIVSVITPYRAQANLIQKLLTEKTSIPDLKTILVGTIDSLQGAEKPIVVFSPTCTLESSRQPFFVRKSNRMNVAVSRAKDSFVVLGDMRLFRGGPLPLALLGKMLFAGQENELTDVEGNYPFTQDVPSASVERLSTPERHRLALRNALAEATSAHPVVIVSPWITLKAIESDDLPGLVSQSVNRGAKIHLIIDRELAFGKPIYEAGKAVARMKSSGAIVHPLLKVHSKTLISSASSLIEGSFNWLSASREQEGTYSRHETSLHVRGDRAVKPVHAALDEFRKLGANID